jgi:hypothetical protein
VLETAPIVLSPESRFLPARDGLAETISQPPVGMDVGVSQAS